MRKIFLYSLLISVLMGLAIFFGACNTRKDESPRFKITIVDHIDGQYSNSYYFYTGDQTGGCMTGPDIFGYTFLGYYTADGVCYFGEDGQQTNLIIDKDITFYSHWTPMECTINFNPGDGVMEDYDKALAVTYGETLTSFPVPEKEGYDFTGWDSDGIMVTDGEGFVLDERSVFDKVNYAFDKDSQTTVSLKATYERRAYTLYLDFNDAKFESREIKVYEGQTIADIELPVEDDGAKRIAGWSIRASSLVEFEGTFQTDITLYAIWKEYCTLTLFVGETEYIEEILYKGEEYNTVPVKHGYEFLGWYKSKLFAGNPTNSIPYNATETIYYAKWSLLTYTLDLVMPDGSIYGTYEYDVNTRVELPVLEDDGRFPFIGWCADEDLSGNSVFALEVGSHDITKMHPKWRNYTVLTLNQMGGESSTIDVKYGSSFTIAPPAEQEDKVFSHWYAMIDGLEVKLTDSNGTGLFVWDRYDVNINVYAKFLNYVNVSVSFIDPATEKEVTQDLGKRLEGNDVMIKKPDELADYEVRGYYINDVLISDEQSFVYTVTESSVVIKIKYSLFTSAEHTSALGNNVYKFNGHYYAVFERVASSWEDAQNYCEFFGGHLVTITSADENEAVISIMKTEAPGKYNCWLGASDVEIDGVWKWVTGEPFAYKNWNKGEPNGGKNENYASYYVKYPNYTWNDSGNSNENICICEWDDGASFRLPTAKELTLYNGEKATFNLYAYKGHYYTLIDWQKLDWHTAERYCEYMGGHLATVSNADENTFLTRLCVYRGANGNYYLGGSDHKKEGTFEWVTGEAFGYTNWSNGEPNNDKNEDYVHILPSGKWNDISSSLYFICEWDSFAEIGNMRFGNFYRKIGTAQELCGLSGAMPGTDVWLTADIDLSGTTWKPFDFSGTINGQNHTIKNLSYTADSGNVGVFNNVTGTIKNVKFEKLNLNSATTGSSFCGVVSYLNGGTIDGITVLSGEVNAATAEVGAIVGQSTNAVIKNCVNYATVTSVNANTSYDGAGTTGGIIGWVKSLTTIENCVNYGAVTGTHEVGGIAGGSSDQTDQQYVNCKNYGNIVGVAYVGGIVGCPRKKVKIDGCIVDCDVISSTKSVKGKYVGWSSADYLNLTDVQIDSVEDLFKIAYNVPQEKFILNCDLDLSGVEWTPVNFDGTFDGQSHIIKNFNYTSESGNAGFFGNVTGTVKNLKFENLNLTSNTTDSSFCGVVSYLHGGTVDGITVLSGEVNAATAETGAVVGIALNGATVKNCVNYATVTAKNDNTAPNNSGTTGGIIGWVKTLTVLENCVNYGNITGTYEVGGIVGESANFANQKYVNCENYGNIMGVSHIGGIVGCVYANVTIDGCLVDCEKISSTANVYGKYVGAGSADYLNLTDIQIDSVEDLFKVTYNISQEKFILNGDLDLAGVNWTPVDFAGTFDGQNHIIKNFSYTAESGHAGFFGKVTGTVKDVKFENLNITSTFNGDGCGTGVIGHLYGTADGITVLSGSVTAVKTETGGIVGLALQNAVVKNCVNYADITVDNQKTASNGDGDTGGVIGGISGLTTVENCVNYGDVTGTYIVGGVVGWSANFAGQKFVNCKNYGSVSGTTLVGGILGCPRATVTIDGCVVDCKVISATDNVFGKYTGLNTTTYVNMPDIEIKDAEDILQMTLNIPQEKYVLSTDIDISGIEWTPVDFTATLDGGLHKISNLTLNLSTGNCGMFKTVSGTVKNLTLSNAAIKSTFNDYTNATAVGGVCAVLTGTLDTVTVDETSTVEGINDHIGGIVGKMTNGQIINCTNNATVVGKAAVNGVGTGGVVGTVTGGTLTQSVNNGTVNGVERVGGVFGVTTLAQSNLTNHGVVSGTSFVGGVGGSFEAIAGYNVSNLTNDAEVSGKDTVGGVFGRLHFSYRDGNTYHAKAINFNNSGTVTATEDNVGGIIGSIYAVNTSGGQSLKILDSANTGNVSGRYYVGGLVGSGVADADISDISNSQSSGTITGSGYVGGIAGKLQLMGIRRCDTDGTSFVVDGEWLDSSSGRYYAYVGGYVGYLTMSLISSVENNVDITYNGKGDFVGGIVGFQKTTGGGWSITDLVNNGNIVATQNVNYVGGVWGDLDGSYGDGNSYAVTLGGLKNNGNVSGGKYVGGIAGYLYEYNTKGGVQTVKFSDTANTGDITGTDIYVGGLFGWASSDTNASELLECSVSGTITGKAYVGGISGYQFGISLNGCINTGAQVIATEHYLNEGVYYGFVGGFVGEAQELIFKNLENAVNINYTGKGIFVGGIAGYYKATGNCTLTNLSNSGTVQSSSDHVGGLFGYVMDVCADGNNYTLTFDHCSNGGAVSGGTHVGGLLGELEANNSKSGSIIVHLTYVTNTADVSGVNNVGGIAGTAYSDTANSYVMEYSNTGVITATAEGALKGDIIGQNTNITVK